MTDWKDPSQCPGVGDLIVLYAEGPTLDDRAYKFVAYCGEPIEEFASEGARVVAWTVIAARPVAKDGGAPSEEPA